MRNVEIVQLIARIIAVVATAVGVFLAARKKRRAAANPASPEHSITRSSDHPITRSQ
jgi:hypothetical protein